MKRTTAKEGCWLAALILLTGTARAADIYVSTNGTQTAPYNTWASAFKDLQTALEYAGAKADATIYLAGGQELTGLPYGKEHPYNTVFCWERATNVRLLGGWDTTAAPPVTRTAGPTVLRRTRGDTRVITLSGLSNCVIEQVSFLEGSNAKPGGAGVYFTNCWNVTLANCVIASNTTSVSGNLGAGLYLNRSHVVLKNSTIADNICNREYSRGAGLYVDEWSRLTAVRSLLLRNKQGGQGGNGSYAGGFFNQGVLELIETVVSGNEADADNVAGGAGVNGGTLLMRNCLVMNNRDSGTFRDGILLSGGSATFINCTIVSNNAVGIRYGGGKVTVSNCIVWGQSAADLLDFPKDKAGVMPDVWYSCIGDGGNNSWQGCFQRDPLFADSIYYHLQSVAGHYANGYFAGGAWAKSAATSPLIDRGGARVDFSREPAPNGGRVNLGAYGNTEVASQSPAVTVVKPSARNCGAVAVGHRTVLLRGEVFAGNAQPPTASFRYWASGGGPTNEIPVGDQFASFQRPVSGLTPGIEYQFLVVAANAAGVVVSEAGSFRTHPSPSFLYVATNGDNTAGTNWATAYSDVQTALNLAEPGDTVYVAGQVFAGGTAGSPLPHPNNAVLIWRSASDVTVRGGYDATTGGGNDPGPRTGEATVIQRKLGHGIRVMTLAGITNCTIEKVAFLDGSDPAGGGYGVYLANCWDVTFAGCVVSNNGGGAFGAYGLGLLLDRSSAILTNTTIANNVIRGMAWGCAGGGIYIDSASRVTAIRSTVTGNGFPESEGNGSEGAGILVASGGMLNMYESVVSGNAGGKATYGGGIKNAGTLLMRNCLVYANKCLRPSADGILLAGGKATVINCTIVGNGGVGLGYAGGAAAVSNCIIWGHTAADLANFPAGSVGYSACAVPNMHGVNGCITNDPQFVGANANDYRLKDAPFSPCIDRGANQSWMAGAGDIGGVPRIVGVAVDMGAYEYRPTAFIRHAGVSGITAKTALIRGNATWPGPANVAMSLFHGPADGGTDPKAWANEVKLPGLRGLGMHEATIAHSASNGVWFYRYCATNPYGVFWAAFTDSFITGAVEVRVTKRESREDKPAAFVITRPATAVNGPLPVYYTLGGSGVHGTDYDPLEAPAIIPSGASEVRLPVVPNFSFGANLPKSVELSLAPGGYLIGVNSNANIVTRAE